MRNFNKILREIINLNIWFQDFNIRHSNSNYFCDQSCISLSLQ